MNASVLSNLYKEHSVFKMRGHAVAQLVGALRYKRENRGFNCLFGSLGHWDF